MGFFIITSQQSYEVDLDVGRGGRYADGDVTETQREAEKETGRDTDADMDMSIRRIRGPRLPGTRIHTGHALAAVIPAPEEPLTAAAAAASEEEWEDLADDRSHDLTRDQSNNHGNRDEERTHLEAAMDVFEGDIIHANTNTNTHETGEGRCRSMVVYGWKFIFLKSCQDYEGRRTRGARERFVPWGPPHQYRVRNVFDDVRRDCGAIDLVLRYMAQHRA